MSRRAFDFCIERLDGLVLQSMSLISVLMPCYNVAPYVSAAVHSVLNQGWKDMELIVVDDGSTDGSMAILRSIYDARLILVEQKQSGAAAARNRAFTLAQGEFVMFMDSDDWVPPEHLEALYTCAHVGDGLVGMGQWDRFYSRLDEAKFPPRPTYRDAPGNEWLVQDWYGGGGMTNPGMFLIPRYLIEEHGGWDERLSLIDDFEFYARIIARSGGVRFAPEARLYYRSGRGDNLSGGRNRKAAESACLSLILGTQHLLEIENSPQTRRACANVLQVFEYGFYPQFKDLRQQVRRRVAELGGADIKPDGPPGFQRLRPWVGWRVARHVQLAAERLRLNGAARAVKRRISAS